MTRPGADGLDSVLAGAHHTRYTARVLIDWDTEILPEVALSAGRFSFDSAKQVRATGTATLALRDAWGRSFEPRQVTDALAPYGNWLEVTCHITAGAFASATVLGTYEITNPERVARGTVTIGGEQFTSSERIGVDLADAFDGTTREEIPAGTMSAGGESTAAEVARLLGLPVFFTVDGPVVADVEYPDDRLKAVFDLVQPLGGTPYVRWDRSVGITPTAWPAPSRVVKDGPGGYAIDARPAKWESEDVKNYIRVTTAEDAPTQLDAAVRMITQGPLRYGDRRTGAWGRYRHDYESSFFTSQDQLEAYADELLIQKSQDRTVGASFSMPADPTLEVGDVVTLATSAVSGLLRVRTIEMTVGSPTMAVTGYLT